ncbi:hypothetical protein D3C81_2178280 [compost metagenome]
MNWQLSRFLAPLLGGLVLSKLNGEWLFGLLGVLIIAGGISMFFVCRAYYHDTASSASGVSCPGEKAAADVSA